MKICYLKKLLLPANKKSKSCRRIQIKEGKVKQQRPNQPLNRMKSQT